MLTHRQWPLLIILLRARIKLIKYLLSLSRQKFKHSSISLKWSTCRTQFVNPSQGTDHHRHTRFYHHASQASPRNILGSGSPYSRWNGGRGTRWQRAVKALTLCYNGAGHPSPQLTTNSSTGVRSERWKRHKSRYLYKPSLHRLWNLWSYDGNVQMRKTLFFCQSETI